MHIKAYMRYLCVKNYDHFRARQQKLERYLLLQSATTHNTSVGMSSTPFLLQNGFELGMKLKL